MKVIFLDFDGVVSKGFTKKFDKMSLFCAFMRQNKDVNVVISSSWRKFRNIDELRLFFEEDVRHQVIGTTPIFTRDGKMLDIPFERSVEINIWLLDHPEVTRYIALDDCPELFDKSFKNLYTVNMGTGLTECDIKTIERIINETNNSRKP